MALPESLRARLADLPLDAISEDPTDLVEYGRDWTREVLPAPSAIVFPRSTAEVSRVLAACNAARVAVVPSGGRTGLAGGAMAPNGEVVVSLEKMRRIDEVDRLGATVRVDAGVVTEAVHDHCAPLGLTWPVDFASKGSSTVGGNLSTNAGGLRVIRYGLTRQWVLGLAAVLADGTVLSSLSPLEKNNTGLDLRQLFIGTEGTLGIVTEATLKLARLPGPTTVMLLGLKDVASVLRLFREARTGPFTIAAYEFFSQRCLDRVKRHRNLRPPFTDPSPYYVVLEVEGAAVSSAADHDIEASRLAAKLEPWLEKVFADGLAQDGTLAQHGGEAKDLWALRESISESLSATGLPHKNDVSLPIAALDAFTADLEKLFEDRYAGWEICLFGHVGDGNLHINVMKPEGMEKPAFFAKTHEVDRDLFVIVQRHGGSISAEHGVGLLKRAFLSFTRSDAEIGVMRAIKHALDPNGILNPGKIFA